MKHLLMGTAAVLLLAPQFAGAQSSQNRGQQQTQGDSSQQQKHAQAGQPVAHTCLNDLQAFRQHVRNDGLWLSGYRTGYGWHGHNRAMLDDQTAAHTAPGTGNTDARAGSEARARAANVQAQGGGATGAGQIAAGGSAGSPWGNVNWTVPPMQQLRALHTAAVVMAQRGEQQGCETVLFELREAYGQYSQQLKQAGGDQNRMRGYRQQQLANARPVGQMDRAFRADNVTGTDVRNAKDEYLGSIEDVMVDPNSGQVSYVILARGGFLGMGEDYIAVPWKQLKATQNMNAFVLNTTDTQLEKAPKVDLQAFSDQQSYNQRRQEIDRFWQQQDTGKSS